MKVSLFINFILIVVQLFLMMCIQLIVFFVLKYFILKNLIDMKDCLNYLFVYFGVEDFIKENN